MNAAFIAFALLAPAAPPDPPMPEVSETVRKGLEALAKQQKPDGSWASKDNTFATLYTATAGLALLMEGSTLKEGTYAPHLRKAVEWFEKKTAAGDHLAKDTNESFYFTRHHVYAMLFLLSVYESDDNADRQKRIAKILDKAIKRAADCQTVNGGWNFTLLPNSKHYNDSESTASLLQALFVARKAKFDVPKKVTDQGMAYLVRVTNREGSVINGHFIESVPKPGAGANDLPSTTSAIVAALSDSDRPNPLPQWIKSASPANLQQIKGLRNGNWAVMYQQFQTARVCFALGENGHRKIDREVPDANLVKWSAYREQLFKELQQMQGKDGLWADPNFGPSYRTATVLVILQLDNQHLPAFAR